LRYRAIGHVAEYESAIHQPPDDDGDYATNYQHGAIAFNAKPRRMTSMAAENMMTNNVSAVDHFMQNPQSRIV
jgi:hypothetical protein